MFELNQMVMESVEAFGRCTPLWVLVTIAGCAAGTHVLSRSKESFVLAATAGIYAIPFLWT